MDNANKNGRCVHCEHPRSDHCKPGTKHTIYHGNKTHEITCEKAHCEQPLCSCIEFVEAQ